MTDRKLAMLVASAFMALIVFFVIRRGELPTGYSQPFRRDEEPFTFWLGTGSIICIAAMFAAGAFL